VELHQSRRAKIFKTCRKGLFWGVETFTRGLDLYTKSGPECENECTPRWPMSVQSLQRDGTLYYVNRVAAERTKQLIERVKTCV
jgi:hypothetical protein